MNNTHGFMSKTVPGLAGYARLCLHFKKCKNVC